MSSPPSASTVDLGIVEGYYGRPWSWDARTRVATRLAARGFRFFLYAPKAATALRRRWREPMPDDELAPLAAFAGRHRGLHEALARHALDRDAVAVGVVEMDRGHRGHGDRLPCIVAAPGPVPPCGIPD